MAGKKVTNKELFGKDIFAGNVKKQAEELLQILDKMEMRIKDVAKQQKEILNNESNRTTKSIKKVNKAVNELNDAERKSAMIRRQREKLERKLSALNSDRIQENEELKVLISEQRKINRQLAKETTGLAGAYDKKSARLRRLRKDYKNLVVEEGKATKETKRLKREITALDRELKEVDAEAGQFFRNIGNYPSALKNATSGFKELAAGAGIAGGVLGTLQQSIQGNAESAGEFEGILLGLGDAASIVFNAIGGAITDLFDVDFAGIFAGTADFPDIGANFEGLGDKIAAAFEAGRESADITRELRKDSIDLNSQLDELNTTIAIQSARADDSTLSFQEQLKALDKLAAAELEREKILLQIAKREELAVQTRLDATQDGQAILELEEELADAKTKTAEAESSLQVQREENAKRRREILRDEFEQELDFAIDLFDRVKTANERILANDELTVSERAKLLEKTFALNEKSFANQEKLVEQFTGKRIDLAELAALRDEELIRDRLRNQGIDEVTNRRILEILRERITFTQDLRDAQIDLNERAREEAELLSDIEVTGDAIRRGSGEDEQLARERFEAQKEFLQEQIDLLKDGSLEELRLKKELNDLILQEQQRRIDKEKEAEEDRLKDIEEAAEKEKEIRETVLETVQEFANERFEAVQENLNNQLNVTEQRIDFLQQKAAEGRLDAAESLAFEQRRRAELQRQEQRERRRQQRAQALFTVLETYNENDQDLGKTIADVQLLRQLAGTLAGFYHGTDDTGKSGPIKDKYGHITGFTHENEMVFSAKQKELLGNRSRDEIISIVRGAELNSGALELAKDGLMSMSLQKPTKSLRSKETALLASKLDRVEKAIQSVELKSDTVTIDSLRNILKHTKYKGNKKITTKSKLY